MKHRTIEISQDGYKLSKTRGFMQISSDEEQHRVVLDDIGMVLVSGRGATYTNSLLVALAERNIPVVICNPQFLPVAWMWPLSGHHTQARNISAQIEAPKPLNKRLWQEIVRNKITTQSAIVDFVGGNGDALQAQAKRVRSGDPENVEAQVARRYWPMLFGPNFRRQRSNGEVNMFLNYGYTVLRACTARAIVSSGLHPSIGIHHSNQYNDFRLADDLVEPFRALVDVTVHQLIAAGHSNMNNAVKKSLAMTVNRDVSTELGMTPVSNAMLKLAQSLARSFRERSVQLDLPKKPNPIEIGALAHV